MAALSRPVKTYVVGGFLGAGKTTYIIEHLKQTGARVAVLVNEFGELGIDGELIRLGGGLEVYEMPGGCICCSQKENLREKVFEIATQVTPDLLLIEPSGVAETSELLKTLADPLLDGVISLDLVLALIDAETFLEFSDPEGFGSFFLDQVRYADLVLVNKADLVSPEVLVQVEEQVMLVNPEALVLRSEFARVVDTVSQNGGTRPVGERRCFQGTDVDSVSLVPEPLTEERFSELLRHLHDGTFGQILRGKGFIHMADQAVSLQVVWGKETVEVLEETPAPRLTLLGFDLRTDRLHRFFLEGKV